MIQGKWFSPGEDLSNTVLPVREAVFGTCGPNIDYDSWNVLVYVDQQPSAAGRIWWKDGAFWLGDIGVLPAMRGQHLGDLVLRLLLYKAQSHSAREVRLHCTDSVEGFFSRLGFRQTGSSSSGIIEMLIPGEEISLDSCAGCRKKECPLLNHQN